MDSAVKPNDEGNKTDDLGYAEYLWGEYQYRHDLIWRLLFRITFVTVLLSIAPFTINDTVRHRADFWIYSLPVLALLLAGGGWVLLWKEFQLFQPIDKIYRCFQGRAMERQLPSWLADDLRKINQEKKKSDIFKLIVTIYPAILILLIAAILGAFIWTGSHSSSDRPPRDQQAVSTATHALAGLAYCDFPAGLLPVPRQDSALPKHAM